MVKASPRVGIAEELGFEQDPLEQPGEVRLSGQRHAQWQDDADEIVGLLLEMGDRAALRVQLLPQLLEIERGADAGGQQGGTRRLDDVVVDAEIRRTLYVVELATDHDDRELVELSTGP